MKKSVPLLLLWFIRKCSGHGFVGPRFSRTGAEGKQRLTSTRPFSKAAIAQLRCGSSLEASGDGSIDSSITASSEVPAAASNPADTTTTAPRVRIQAIKNSIVPAMTAIISFCSYGVVSKTFNSIVQWASGNKWFRDTLEEVELQSNIITQVVNGPVVVSISVLFATLISTTVSSLQTRQEDVQASLVNEVQCWRQVQSLVYSSLFEVAFSKDERQVLLELINIGQGRVKEEIFIPARRPSFAAPTGGKQHQRRRSRPDNPHEYIEANTRDITKFCDQLELSIRQQNQDTVVSSSRCDLASTVLAKVRDFLEDIRSERSTRWVSVTAMHYPPVHYITLSLLVLAILMAFLVQTDHAEFVFLDGLQLRILWSLLLTCFSSIAVLLVDLSDAFSGAYAVSSQTA